MPGVDAPTNVAGVRLAAVKKGCRNDRAGNVKIDEKEKRILREQAKLSTAVVVPTLVG